MSDLSFLKGRNVNVGFVFEKVIFSMINNEDIEIDGLKQHEIEKIRLVIKFLIKQKSESYLSMLNELNCKEPEVVERLIKKYEKYLDVPGIGNNLIDFDWSTSVILSTNNFSNLKQPISTFKFDISTDEGEKTKYVELTIEEAEGLLDTLKNAMAQIS